MKEISYWVLMLTIVSTGWIIIHKISGEISLSLLLLMAVAIYFMIASKPKIEY